jgi:hypothetical protein
MATHEYSVEVQPDFLERQAKALPVSAVAELIWNGLDADATTIEVEFGDDSLGGMSRIAVSDNGHGIPFSDAPTLFRNLGGSWKKRGARTKKLGRVLHGQEGRGRFKAFALGGVVDWKVVYHDGTQLLRYDISILESDIKKVKISDEAPFAGGASGVTVVVSELKRQFSSLRPEHSLQELSEIFAIYLKNYRDVHIRLAGQRIDPSNAIAETWNVPLTAIVDEAGKTHSVSLEVIEWRRQTKRALYLCNEEGFPLSQIESRFHVGDFQFSAYLKSSFISDLHQDNQLEMAEMVPSLAAAVEESRDRIKVLFREKAAERARVVVDEWKAKNVYPFQGEAKTPVERAERQIFDIVAVTVQDAAPDLKEASSTQLEMHLRMLRYAIERSPAELQTIFHEVLKLPLRKQKEMAALLEETTLSGIISAASEVADRLKFITGLEAILFDPDLKKRVKERSQLHKIIETKTWIFGEEYNLWVSDRSLTEILRHHKSKLDPTIVIDEPVKHVSQERGIVDLMLSRAQKKHRADDTEHLVIELKAPKAKLKAADLSQLEGYAASVADDPRFRTVPGLRWHFWLVSDEYNKEIEFRLKGHPEGRFGIVTRSDNITVGVKTWGQIIEENRARLQFFQEHLDHRIDQSDALQVLQEKHRKFLEGVIVEDVENTDPESHAQPSR